MSAVTATPKTSMNRNTDCQPKVSSSQPPTIGLIIGTSDMPMVT